MKTLNSSILIAVLFLCSQSAFAALKENQSQALREHIHGRINSASPGTLETITLLQGIVKSVETRIAEVQVAVKGEIARGSRELAVFEQKVKVPFNPIRNATFRQSVYTGCQKSCCDEYGSRRKSKGG